MGLITVDQMIAGASNVLIAVLAARLLGVSSFGLFGLVFLVYVLSQCVSRAVACDPLLVHSEHVERRTGEVIGTVVLIGCVLGGLVSAIGLITQVWNGDLGRALIVLGICLPLLTLQDLGRYLGFALQRPGSAVALDSLWLGLVVGAVAALIMLDVRTLTWFIIAWAGSGAVAGLLLFVQFRRVTIRITTSWIRFTWGFSWRYLISYLATQGAALAGSGVVGALAGVRALGSVQGTILLVRPFGTIQLAAVAAGVADISRSAGTPAQVRRRGVQISTLLTLVAVLNAIVLIVLPDSLGRLVLGDTWNATKPLLLATSVQLVALGVLTGARAVLLGSRAVRWTLRIDVVSTIVVLGAVSTGTAVGGVRYALWFVAVAQSALAVLWWLVASRYLATQQDPTPTDGLLAGPGAASMLIESPPGLVGVEAAPVPSAVAGSAVEPMPQTPGAVKVVESIAPVRHG